jgi:hypothetical protein
MGLSYDKRDNPPNFAFVQQVEYLFIVVLFWIFHIENLNLQYGFPYSEW